ncbi:hypothetical protein BRDID11002_31880 [Bradyrhizobium diazoefficiens]
MSSLPMQVALMLGETIAKVVPITLALAAVFTVLEHFWACNPGTPWWRKRRSSPTSAIGSSFRCSPALCGSGS